MYPPRQRESVKDVVRKFITNPKKVLFVEQVPELQDEVIPLLPRKDLYIVQMCLASTDKIVITSDTTLYQNLIDTFEELNIQVYMVEDFISRYPDI